MRKTDTCNFEEQIYYEDPLNVFVHHCWDLTELIFLCNINLYFMSFREDIFDIAIIFIDYCANQNYWHASFLLKSQQFGIFFCVLNHLFMWVLLFIMIVKMNPMYFCDIPYWTYYFIIECRMMSSANIST